MTPRTDIEDMTDAQDEARATAITLTYRNWRGEIGQRTIEPRQVFFGSTDWHPEPGWLLEAWDFDKGAVRDFALADCQFADLARPSQAGDERVARAVRALDDAIASAEADIDADAEAGERIDLSVYEVGLPLETARVLFAALAAMDTPKGGGDE